MATIQKKKVVTEFVVNLQPSEYEIIRESLENYLDELTKIKKELAEQEEDTEFEETYIKEVSQLKKELDDAYENEWIKG